MARRVASVNRSHQIVYDNRSYPVRTFIRLNPTMFDFDLSQPLTSDQISGRLVAAGWKREVSANAVVFSDPARKPVEDVAPRLRAAAEEHRKEVREALRRVRLCCLELSEAIRVLLATSTV